MITQNLWPTKLNTELSEKSTILAGRQLSLLSYGQKVKYALQISGIVKSNPRTMLYVNWEEIIISMDQGKSIIALNINDQSFAGYGRLYQWEGTNTHGEIVYEFRTWISGKRGVGTKILFSAIKLGQEINKDAQLIAIVAQENLKPRAIIHKAGGIKINKPKNISLLLNGGKTPVVIYKLTDVITGNKSHQESTDNTYRQTNN